MDTAEERAARCASWLDKYNVRAAVQAGAALLDEKVPGWYARVDTETLEMDNPRRCILGQVFKGASREYSSDYLYAVEALGLTVGTLGPPGIMDTHGMGFSGAEWGILRLEWRAAIEARR